MVPLQEDGILMNLLVIYILIYLYRNKMLVKDLKIGTKFQTRNNKNIYTVISNVKNIDGIDSIMIKVEDSNGDVYDKEICPYIRVDKILK